MSEPRDMLLPLLREIREQISTLQTTTQDEFQAVKARLDAIEDVQATFRTALAADSLVTRLVTGDFELRIEQLEQGLAELRGKA